MIAIIDYGAGNLGSVEKAFRMLGAEVLITANPNDVLQADGVVLPGVGHFKDCMDKITCSNMDQAIAEVIQNQRPFLGICVGLQMLFESSEEGKEPVAGLGILKGKIKKFCLPKSYKVPHMGWNQVQIKKNSPIFAEIADASYFYFVHTYYLEAEDPEMVIGTTDYGIIFDAVIQQNALFACQFHPEKSGKTGLKFLRNFVEFVKEGGENE
ncbi:MAG TPA: imidazole glycerol phosphate synthase subunit HisH [Firmicutes bacterium]|nr:imidazole glycerol phosphate synthase subunit HisH [Bacillales bacterium]HJA40327.1 imidazole glycerol phosphate synthase subunit HisH [Bacillota bacterium]